MTLLFSSNRYLSNSLGNHQMKDIFFEVMVDHHLKFPGEADDEVSVAKIKCSKAFT